MFHASKTCGPEGVTSTVPALTKSDLLRKGHVMATDQSSVTYRDIPDFPGYRVGDDGSVWSCLRFVGLGKGRGTKSHLSDTWHQLKPTPKKSGHLKVTLCCGGKKVTSYVHAIVLLAFRGPCPPGEEGCHDDGNPLNNCIGNLRWDTPKGNTADRVRHGRQFFAVGAKHGQAVLDDVKAMQIFTRCQAGESQGNVAKDFGVTRSAVSAIATRRTWKHIHSSARVV